MNTAKQCARCGQHNIWPDLQCVCEVCGEVTCIGCRWKHEDCENGLFIGGPLDGKRMQADTNCFETAVLSGGVKMVRYRKRYNTDGVYTWALC